METLGRVLSQDQENMSQSRTIESEWEDDAGLENETYRPFVDKNGKTLGYGVNPLCEKCGGIGWVQIIHTYQDDVSFEQFKCDGRGCLGETWGNYRNGSAGMSKRGIANVIQNFDTFKGTKGTGEMVKALKEMVEGNTGLRLLLVYGTTGNGKTHGCNAMAMGLSKRGRQVKVWAIADLFSMLRKAIETNTTELEVQALKDIDVLVLDDWASEYATDWQKGKMEEVVDYRYRQGKMTVLTTNRSLGDIPDRIVSRFMEKRISRVVENKARDYRMGR